MQIGISTASLFARKTTEEALEYFNQQKMYFAEVFLESFCEYNKEFGEFLNEKKGMVEVHSIHTLTTQFEPTLYSLNLRAQQDSFKILEKVLTCAQTIGAKYYTFHGPARLKRTPLTINFDRMGEITQNVIDLCAKYDIALAYENVHWCYYNYVGFYKQLKSRVQGLKGTLDIKQARQSNVDYREFLTEMGKDIVTVHLSDIDANGKMCLPGKGVFDFDELFSRLNDVGFDGGCLIEAYQSDYNNLEELFESLEFIKNIAKKHYINLKI